MKDLKAKKALCAKKMAKSMVKTEGKKDTKSLIAGRMKKE